ncbi:protein PELPK1 [Lactuca sativa]|uniref:protein PELPK1 n=1 Tax=Lactuca sativa TaxID=4236 RepID=UPI000CD9F2DD|nr:protein PELPK1 [Lactuca sativa]
MEAITLKFASVVLFLSMITLFFVASADSSYGKPQLNEHLPPKPVIPKEEHGAYEKSNPKIPTKAVIPKEEFGAYKKSNPKVPTKPMIPKKEYGADEKINPKVPTKPVIPKDEHIGTYEKRNPKLPTKPVIPKEEHGAYGKGIPKIPTKPVITKAEHGAYGKNNPKLPKELVIPKEEHGGYGKNNPKIPTPKPLIPKEEHGAYGKINPKIPTPEKPKLPKVSEHLTNIAVQGLIYCKYGSKLIPLKGATVRVTCLAVHKNGYESAPFSFSSCPTDVKGYFLAKISSSELLKNNLWEVTECKSFLENSPWPGCKVPEDTNGGITGAQLTFSRMLNGYSLSSVGPFIYNAGPQPSLTKEGY